MADIFSAKPGKVVAVDGTGLPMNISIGRPATAGLKDSRWLGFSGFKSIIQGIGLNGQAGVQFMHTLGDYIYVYIFGERAGDLQIHGLSFHSTCDDPDPDPNLVTGIERMIEYYENFSVTTYPLALTVTIGTLISFDAFLIGHSPQIVNPETNLAQFTLTLKYIPNSQSQL